jgi:hypothetical protein
MAMEFFENTQEKHTKATLEMLNIMAKENYTCNFKNSYSDLTGTYTKAPFRIPNIVEKASYKQTIFVMRESLITMNIMDKYE